MPARFFAPRYWPAWLVIALLRLIEHLPYRSLLAVGRALGRIARRLPLHFVPIARANMRLCLPDLSEDERERLLDRHFEALGMSMCESAMTWWSDEERIVGLARIEGIEHLKEALARGRGAIILTAHFTTLEIGARILNAAFPINVLYKPPKNELLAYIANSHRESYKKAEQYVTIERDDIRSMVRALRRNECVWYAPDQAFRSKGAEMVPFFGVPAATNVATSRLAELTGAAVLLFSHERLPDAQGYRIAISAPLPDYPGRSAYADALRFNHFIEAEVRRIPEQYWWIHRRFKGLTSDYPNYYGAAARKT
jgi:Kdo2-lipid IVA lauroyltransferase/acyltransferase